MLTLIRTKKPMKKLNIFYVKILESVFKNVVYEISTIFFRHQCVNGWYYLSDSWHTDITVTSKWARYHRCLDCLLNLLFKHRSKKTSKLRVTGHCEWNPPVTGRFPSQRASNAENLSIPWRHHDIHFIICAKCHLFDGRQSTKPHPNKQLRVTLCNYI